MATKIESMHSELKVLIANGNHLYLAMINKVRGLDEDFIKELEEKKIILPDFIREYDTWYSEALAVIKQLLPDRQSDFIRQYKPDKRKKLTLKLTA